MLHNFFNKTNGRKKSKMSYNLKWGCIFLLHYETIYGCADNYLLISRHQGA